MKRAILILMMFVMAGCRSTSTKYMHPNADLGAIEKVAVLPFENLTTEQSAPERVQKIFYLELLALEVFDVAEPGQVAKTTKGSDPAMLGTSELQRIGKDLGVDGLFVGSVIDYADTRTGTTPTPEVTIEVRLIETQTGATIWSTSHTRAGAGVSTRLFGLGGESLTEAARKVVRRELATLLK